jgi:hypothetical protein
VGGGSAIPFGVEAGSSRVFVAALGGLWVVDHASGAASRFAEPPDDDDSDSGEAAHFVWLLRLSPSHDEVLALGLATNPRFAVYRIPVDGRPRSRFRLDGWPAGLDGSYVHGWVCCPAYDGGARLFDLDGRTVATLPYRFRGCAIDPSAPRIALFGTSGLFLWDPPRRRLDRLRDARCFGAAWSPDGSSVFWIPRQSQLHVLDVDARRSSQWVALRDDAYSGDEYQGYAQSPLPSPDGGQVVCALTRSRPATADELEQHRDWYRQVRRRNSAVDVWTHSVRAPHRRHRSCESNRTRCARMVLPQCGLATMTRRLAPWLPLVLALLGGCNTGYIASRGPAQPQMRPSPPPSVE